MDRRNGRWKIRCVIYDCDGVIIDSLDSNRLFYNTFRTRLGLPPLTAEELQYAHTHTVDEALRFIFRPYPESGPRAFELYSRVDPEEFLRRLKLEPNIVPALSRIGELGILRAISTSRSTHMKSILAQFALEPYFDLVVTAADVKNPKPHPESVEKILRNFSLEKSTAVLVGDSENDLKTARAAGIRFIAYKNRELGGDAHIDDHLAIFHLLSRPEDHEDED